MPGKGKCGCKLKVGDFGRGYYAEFPLSRSGWGSALKRARADRKRGNAVTLDLVCDDGSMALAQFRSEQKTEDYEYMETISTMEDQPNLPAIAGRRRRSR